MVEQHDQNVQDHVKNTNQQEDEYKPTRRDKRAGRELDKLKAKINQAGETNFDELSQEPLNAGQMDESLLGIASDIKPTKEALFE